MTALSGAFEVPLTAANRDHFVIVGFLQFGLDAFGLFVDTAQAFGLFSREAGGVGSFDLGRGHSESLNLFVECLRLVRVVLGMFIGIACLLFQNGHNNLLVLYLFLKIGEFGFGVGQLAFGGLILTVFSRALVIEAITVSTQPIALLAAAVFRDLLDRGSFLLLREVRGSRKLLKPVVGVAKTGNGLIGLAARVDVVRLLVGRERRVLDRACSAGIVAASASASARIPDDKGASAAVTSGEGMLSLFVLFAVSELAAFVLVLGEFQVGNVNRSASQALHVGEAEPRVMPAKTAQVAGIREFGQAGFGTADQPGRDRA
ncbi:MAG: hypothetical protein ACREE2_14355 [Stellaceae bacterium]